VAERLSLEVRTSLTRAPSSGDPDLTERLVANLVDNALRYNIAGGWVELVTGTDTGEAMICVSNTRAPDMAARLQSVISETSRTFSCFPACRSVPPRR